MSDEQPEYQAVRLRLSDGREGTFMGPVLVRGEHDLTVVNVTFFAPRPLPPGYSFETMEPAKPAASSGSGS